MIDLTVIILTYNESLHIERCIKNIQQIAKDIIIIDSFSTDNTISIAESLSVKVFQRSWKNHSDQFQWALDNCPINTEWVMRLDADEYLENPLINEIKQKLPTLSMEIGGIYLKRKHFFLGRWIKHGDRYPVVLLRIWRYGQAHIENRWMDEHMILDKGKSLTFDNDFVDDNLNTVSWFINKHNNYSNLEMIEILTTKYNLFHDETSLIESKSINQAKLKRLIKNYVYNKLPIFVRPSLYFCYRYFIRLGFLDGVEGFAYHFMQGFWYRCLVDLKCLEAERFINLANSNNDKIKILSELTKIELRQNEK